MIICFATLGEGLYLFLYKFLNKNSMAKTKKHLVYILVKDNTPVYVGCTSNITNRLYKHKATKDFDRWVALKYYSNKKDALNAENAIIRFISLFGGNEWLNAKHQILEMEENFRKS